jgi:hypothetical protein
MEQQLKWDMETEKDFCLYDRHFAYIENIQ